MAARKSDVESDNVRFKTGCLHTGGSGKNNEVQGPLVDRE